MQSYLWEAVAGPGQADVLHLQVHFSNGCNDWSWVRMKPGAGTQELLWVAYMGVEPPRT